MITTLGLAMDGIGAIACLLLFATLAHASDGSGASASGSFGVDAVKVELKYAYTWLDSSDMPQMDGPPVRLRFISLSDQPFDAASLDLVSDPTINVDIMAIRGATVVTAGMEASGKVHLLRYALPAAKSFVMYDVELVEGQLREKDGLFEGVLTVLPNQQAHDFDPDNWPLVQGKIEFKARETRTPLTGKPLEADGGEPGRAYRGFNDALAGEDREAIGSRLRTAWTAAGEQGGDVLQWKETRAEKFSILEGRSDGMRAVLVCRGNSAAFGEDAEYRVFLVNEDGVWKVDVFRPGRE